MGCIIGGCRRDNIALYGALVKQIEKYEGGATLESNKTATITENGTTVINPSSGNDAMKKATITVAVPLPTLETNKTETINVSTYSEPVEITPSSQKDAMEKVTVTLSNIPSSDKSLYCFVNETDSLTVYAYSATPQADDDVIVISDGAIEKITEGITAVEDDTITVDSVVYIRDSLGDISI